MNKGSGLTLTCRQCGKEFVFAASEQSFYQEKGFVSPLHCKECRTNRRNQLSTPCSNCGTDIPKGAPVFCNACLTTVQLEVELESRRVQNTIEESGARLKALEAEKTRLMDEANSRLFAVESEKSRIDAEAEAKYLKISSGQAGLLQEAAEKLKVSESEKAGLTELLQQKGELTADLEKRLGDVQRDLDKAVRNQARLDWLEPALNTLKDQIGLLERNQYSLNQTIKELVRKSDRIEDNFGVLEMIKRIFRPRRRSPEPGR